MLGNREIGKIFSWTVTDLEEAFVVPVAVDLSQSADDAIVFAHEDDVEGGETGILGGAHITGLETAAGRGLALALAARLGQQVLAAEPRQGDVEPATGEGAQTARLARRTAVDVRRVDIGRILVDLFASTQPLLAGKRARERHA